MVTAINFSKNSRHYERELPLTTKFGEEPIILTSHYGISNKFGRGAKFYFLSFFLNPVKGSPLGA
jgi:hypothetical protein